MEISNHIHMYLQSKHAPNNTITGSELFTSATSYSFIHPEMVGSLYGTTFLRFQYMYDIVMYCITYLKTQSSLLQRKCQFYFNSFVYFEATLIIDNNFVPHNF